MQQNDSPSDGYSRQQHRRLHRILQYPTAVPTWRTVRPITSAMA